MTAAAADLPRLTLPRLVTLHQAKQYLAGLTPEALGVPRIPNVRRLVFDLLAIDQALDWLRGRGPAACPHCGRPLDKTVNRSDQPTDASETLAPWEASLAHAEHKLRSV